MIIGKTWTINCDEQRHPTLHFELRDGAHQIDPMSVIDIGDTGITTIQLLIDNIPRELIR